MENTTSIRVLGYDGQLIGYAKSYGEAKRMQLQDLQDNRPEMVDAYVGISTNSDNAGMPLYCF